MNDNFISVLELDIIFIFYQAVNFFVIYASKARFWDLFY